jgi:GAF domain-containing protein
MLGHGLHRVIPSDLVRRHDEGLARLSRGAAPVLLGGTTEVPVLHADGRRLTVELSLSSWSQDDRTGFTAVLRDVTARRRAELLADLVRSAASAASSAPSFPVGAGVVLRDVCERLGWLAAHAGTGDDPSAVWAVAPHAHGPGAGCELADLAARGDVPTADQVPVDARTRVTAATALDAGLEACGIDGVVAVPVLAGEQAVAVLAFYLPGGAGEPDAAVLSTLEQIGTLLGRVVERDRSSALLRHQAEHDPLTDLPNRRRLLQEVSRRRPPPPRAPAAAAPPCCWSTWTASA